MRHPFLCVMFVLTGAFGAMWSTTCHAREDTLICSEHRQAVICSLSIPNYVQRMAPFLTNGWENAIRIDVLLLDAGGTRVLRKSELQATQRCYLDPFESPCLLLWRGAKNWITYRDEAEFLEAISNFTIQALKLEGLPPDNYRVRVLIHISANNQKQIATVKQWFKQIGSDTAGFHLGETTLVGSFMSIYTAGVEQPAQTLILETAQFYIDLNFSVTNP
ncbi:MAG: hypothetical protein FWC40_09785 [Proteobacteria bacterium]|nr:hypothetical protein [Pseudomonadota bacterium]